MTITDSSTTWRDTPLVPSGYDDVAALVKLARRARYGVVDFDWVFTEPELRELREAVHHWGSNVVGRYKCFDARVLAAVSDALGEHDTVFFLSEPKSMADLDCRVACGLDGDAYHLRGHAAFDLAYGYGHTAVQGLNPRLGASTAAKLAATVGSLGWDLERLKDRRLTPVTNVIFGFSVGHGISADEPNEGPISDVPVHFHGPYAAAERDGLRCLFTDPIAEQGGVYLWTIDVGGQERPWYVGQTQRRFGQRIGEHISGFLSGAYETLDPSQLAQGKKVVIWPGASNSSRWPQAFLEGYERISPPPHRDASTPQVLRRSARGRRPHSRPRRRCPRPAPPGPRGRRGARLLQR